MDKNECCLWGTFVKVNGVKGELILKSNYLLSEDFESILSVFIEIEGILIPFFISDFIIRSDYTAIIKLDDIDNKNKALEFLDKDVFIPKENFPVFTNLPFELSQLIGYEIYDNMDKKTGKIIETIDIRQNPIAKIIINKKEVLIPVNDDTIISIDNKNKIIKLNIAKGLLDIYL